VSGGLQRFLDDFGKIPEGEPREHIAPQWRMPVFLGMIAIGIVGLLLLWFLVVGPALHLSGRHTQLGQPIAPASSAQPSVTQ
jgi:hypothetical protein